MHHVPTRENESYHCIHLLLCQDLSVCASRWDNVCSLSYQTVNTTYQQLKTYDSCHYCEVLFRYDGLDEHWSHWLLSLAVWSNTTTYWQLDGGHKVTWDLLRKILCSKNVSMFGWMSSKIWYKLLNIIFSAGAGDGVWVCLLLPSHLVAL